LIDFVITTSCVTDMLSSLNTQFWDATI